MAKRNGNGKALRIIPLGGLDGIGKNMTVIEYGDDMILDDAGLMFPDDNHPGIDLLLPDYTYVLENEDKLRGIIITHGHEDHTGALPYLLASKGSVVGVISIAGYSALPARTGYSSSKYAVRGFLDTLRIEHLKDGLNVLVFAPGYTASNVRNAALTADGTPQGKTPLEEGKLMSAEECALHLAKALQKRRSQKILTFLGKATVWAHRLFPNLTDRLTYGYIAREADSPFK